MNPFRHCERSEAIQPSFGLPPPPAPRNDDVAEMGTYTATIRWNRDGATYTGGGRYSRAHEWAFDGGT